MVCSLDCERLLAHQSDPSRGMHSYFDGAGTQKEIRYRILRQRGTFDYRELSFSRRGCSSLFQTTRLGEGGFLLLAGVGFPRTLSSGDPGALWVQKK